MVVQRGFHVEQCAGDVEQGFLVRATPPAGDVGQHAALFIDHPSRHRQGEHAQRVADPFEHLALLAQPRRIGLRIAQEQVQRFLDPQQVVLQRARHRIEQCAVVAGHRAARVRDFASLRRQRVQRVGLPQQVQLRRGGPRLRDDVEQLARQFVGVAGMQAFLAAVDELAQAAIDAADQLAHLAGLAAQGAPLDAFEHRRRDPPQATPRHAVAMRRDRQQGLLHAGQWLSRRAAAKPGQQLLLETHPQLGQFAATGRRHRHVGGARRSGRQGGIEVGTEHYRFMQRRLLAAGAQFVEQRQQHYRHVTVAGTQALEVVRQLHQAAHQRRIGFLALGDVVLHQRDGQRFHLLGDHRRAVQLDHPQRALHLVQVVRAGADPVALSGVVDVCLQRLARGGERLLQLGLDPLQGGEVDVVLKSHASLSPVAQRSVRAASSLSTWPGPSVQSGNLKCATERRRSLASCAR